MKCQARLTPRSERISRPCCPLFRCFSWRGGWTILEGVFDPDTPRDEIENITVVYAEDDERLGRLTAQYLRSHGIQVELVTRGDQALAEVLRVRPDAVLLDLMLPGRSGLEVCRDLRAHVDVPMVLGLEGGADDYITKPFSSRQLLARIRAQVRRSRGLAGPRPQQIAIGNLRVDTSTMTATLDGEPLALTTYEFALLRVFAERVGRVLTRDQLMQLVRGSSDEAFDRSIDVHISRLRQKLGDDPRNPRRLKTIRGVGYMLAADR